MRESEIQKAIMTHLTKEGWLCIKLIQSNWNGIPDLMCLRGGQAVFIEVKQPGKKPKDLQIYRMKKLNELGFHAFAATAVEDVQNFFDRTVNKRQTIS